LSSSSFLSSASLSFALSSSVDVSLLSDSGFFSGSVSVEVSVGGAAVPTAKYQIGLEITFI
jgi:hypothetical protein